MAAAHTEQPGDADVRTVRLDLTRLDLRSGTIRLPLQEHDCFPPGGLRGVSHPGGREHQLHFESPRELHGLRGFFEENELRPNDAVIIHLHGSHVELEPFRRRSRRKREAPASATDDPGQPAAEQEETLAVTDPAPPEPDTSSSGWPQAEAAPDQEPTAIPSGESAHEPPKSEPEPPVQQAVTAAIPEIPEPVHPESRPASPEPQELPEAAEPDPEQPARTARYPFLAEAPAKPEPAPHSPEAAAGKDPTGEHSTGEETAKETAAPAEQQKAAHYHATRRRPFTPRERGPTWVASRPAAPWLEAAARARGQSDSPPGGAAPASQPEDTAPPPEAAPPPPAAAGPEAAVRRWLERPDLPSIIQAAQVARQLQLGKEETSTILEKLSTEPDSRLSSVRPGFWLLKRQQPGS